MTRGRISGEEMHLDRKLVLGRARTRTRRLAVDGERRRRERASLRSLKQDSHLGEVAGGVSVRDPSWVAVGALVRELVLGRLRRCEAWLAGSRAAFASGLYVNTTVYYYGF